MLTMYFRILMDSRGQMKEMYESLGIEPVWEEASPECWTAEKTQRVRYAERLGNVFIWAGEKLVQHARNNTFSQ